MERGSTGDVGCRSSGAYLAVSSLERSGQSERTLEGVIPLASFCGAKGGFVWMPGGKSLPAWASLAPGDASVCATLRSPQSDPTFPPSCPKLEAAGLEIANRLDAAGDFVPVRPVFRHSCPDFSQDKLGDVQSGGIPGGVMVLDGIGTVRLGRTNREAPAWMEGWLASCGGRAFTSQW